MQGFRRPSFLSGLKENIVIALTSLRAHTLRAFLTLLGIMIGVSTVIAVVSVISGMNNYVIGTLSSMGSDNFTITRIGLATDMETFLEKSRRPRITLSEEETVQRLCGLCEDVGAQVVAEGRVKYGREHIDDTYEIGITANIVALSNWNLARGRDLTEIEVDHRRSVCILGHEVAETLFSGLDPIEKRVRLSGIEFTVIGVIEKQGTFFGESMDNFILIPITTFQKHHGAESSVDIVVRASDKEQMFSTREEIRAIFRSIRELPIAEEDDFDIITSEMLIDLYRSFTGIAFLVTIGVSAISLIVGGIVIMNIMLVSVTERTKEIGLRKAIGASRKDILNQFLAESVTVSAVGGLLGILIGVAIAKAVAHLSPVPASIETWSIFAGLIISSVIGVFFGIFPAMRAARMNPIDALRTE